MPTCLLYLEPDHLFAVPMACMEAMKEIQEGRAAVKKLRRVLAETELEIKTAQGFLHAIETEIDEEDGEGDRAEETEETETVSIAESSFGPYADLLDAVNVFQKRHIFDERLEGTAEVLRRCIRRGDADVDQVAQRLQSMLDARKDQRPLSPTADQGLGHRLTLEQMLGGSAEQLQTHREQADKLRTIIATLQSRLRERAIGLSRPRRVALDESIDWTDHMLGMLMNHGKNGTSKLMQAKWLFGTSALKASVRLVDDGRSCDIESEHTGHLLRCFDPERSAVVWQALRSERPLWEEELTSDRRMTGEPIHCLFGMRLWQFSQGVLLGCSRDAILGTLVSSAIAASDQEKALAELGRLGYVPAGSGTNRTAIPAAVREAVWHRDGGRCQECSAQSDLEFDHIVPVSRGGSNGVANVRLLCQRCNRKRGDNIGR